MLAVVLVWVVQNFEGLAVVAGLAAFLVHPLLYHLQKQIHIVRVLHRHLTNIKHRRLGPSFDWRDHLATANPNSWTQRLLHRKLSLQT